MNAQQLKNAILQEAIEGRLVPQDPNDEPASVLLQRIRKEKERLVKEGKLKKKDLEVKPISEDEKPFEIPESWEWVRLSSLSSAIHYGFTASAAPTGNARLLRITDIQDDTVDWKSVPYCTTKDKDLKTYQLKNRDILIARTGGTIGKTYIVRQLEDVAVFASYLIRVIPLEEINEEFLKLFMMTPCYWKQLIDASSGTGQPNVNGQSLSNLIIPIPPQEEQKRILSKYKELLPKVEEYGKAQEALDKLNTELPERLKKSILQEAISGRLVAQAPNDEPASVLLEKIRKEKAQLLKAGKLKKKDLIETPINEDEIPFEIPDSWEWVRLGDISLDSADGPFGSNLKKDHYTTSKEVRIIQLSNIGELGWKDANTKYTTYKHLETIQRSEAFAGDIIIAKMMPAGRAIICPSDDNKYVLSSDAVRFDFSNYLFKKYLYYSINSSIFKSQVYGNVQGITRVRTSLTKLRNYLIPLPPLAEQHRIVAKLEQLLGEIDKLK